MKKVFILTLLLIAFLLSNGQQLNSNPKTFLKGYALEKTNKGIAETKINLTSGCGDTVGKNSNYLPELNLANLHRGYGLIDYQNNLIGYWYGTSGSPIDTALDVWVQCYENLVGGTIKISGIGFWCVFKNAPSGHPELDTIFLTINSLKSDGCRTGISGGTYSYGPGPKEYYSAGGSNGTLLAKTYITLADIDTSLSGGLVFNYVPFPSPVTITGSTPDGFAICANFHQPRIHGDSVCFVQDDNGDGWQLQYSQYAYVAPNGNPIGLPISTYFNYNGSSQGLDNNCALFAIVEGAAPSVNSPINYCQNATSIPLTAAGTNLLWYTQPTGGVGSVTAPTPSTATVGTTTYYVSQTVGGCESPRASIVVNIIAGTVAPAVSSPVTYMQYATASPLTATGSNLRWYNVPSGGVGSATAPTPSTTIIGTTTYYVSQTLGSCESQRAAIIVNIVSNCPAPQPTLTGASRCGSGSLTLHASGGTMYLWYNALSGGNVVNIGGTFNTPTLNSTTTYYVSNFDSCESARVPVLAKILNLNVDAGNNQTLSCGNSVSLNAITNYNGSLPLTYAWSPIAGLSSATIANPLASPVQTTTYSIMVSDGNCTSYDNVTLNVTPATIGVAFTANQQLIYVPPFAVQFTNQTPSMGNYNFTWYFGDGTVLQSNNATVFHQYAQNGLYDVTLEATSIATGCTETLFKDDWIFCAGGSACTHTATINQNSPVSGCVGTPVNLTCNTVTGASYQWNYNGIPLNSSNSTSYFANAAGNYSVTIVVNGCPVSSNIVAVTFSNPPAIPVITSTGSLTYCGGGSLTLNAPAGASSYLWSNGATTQSITITQSGTFTVQVTDNTGCASQSLPFLAGASPLANPDICIVSVDSISGKNVIVWNKPVSTAIDHFNVYGEGMQANVFGLLGSVAYSSLSIFMDNTSVPAQQAYRYEISAVDTCGAETVLSSYHKSIHLTINQGMGSTYNLIWSYYEGFSFPSYRIYRGTSPSNMTLLTTVASTLNSYTDLTPPGGLVYYQIEAVNPNPCTPSKTTYNTTRSNIASNNVSAVNGGIEKNEMFSIFPNPVINTLTIQSDKIISVLTVYDLTGRLLLKAIGKSIDCSNLPAGMYHCVITIEDGTQRALRFVKE